VFPPIRCDSWPAALAAMSTPPKPQEVNPEESQAAVEQVPELDNPVQETVSGKTSAKVARKPTVVDYVTATVSEVSTAPCQLFRFLVMLYRTFGGYVPAAVLQYGLNQGVGMSVGNMARRVFFSDVLQLDGATAGRYVAAAMVPWCVKPVFGMFSDAVPIFGYHRTSYIVLAGICGVLAWTCLGALPLAGIATVPFLVLVNVSVAMPDVMIDARTAELSRDAPEHASNLQSLSWGALSIGGLITCTMSGFLVETLGPRTVFFCINICSLGVLVPGLLRWLGEKRLPRGERKFNLQWLRKHATVTLLALYMSAMAVTLSMLQIFVESSTARGVVTLVCALILIAGIFTALKRVNMLLAKTAIFIFARECLQPTLGEAMFQWMKNAPDGPQFSPTVMSWVDCFGSLGLLFGIVIYNKFLTEVPFRRIFFFAQVAMVFCNLFDYVLVKRWNLLVGVPDIVMLIGDDALTTTMRRFFAMPMMVLAAKVCPSNIEATLFAMLMALSNFGGIVGDFVGVSMLEVFGVVDGNYEHLPAVVLSKSLCRLLPLVLIPVLVPDLRPNDPIPAEEGSAAAAPEAEVEANKEASA